jgi:SagB-type dehydrogenase family enzyme
MAKEELRRLVELLSNDECQHVLRTVQDVAAGERFWESDISTLYNESVKTRATRNGGGYLSNAIPSAPVTEEGIFAPVPIVKSYRSAERIRLPPSEFVAVPLGKAIRERRSRREYLQEAISLGQLATLLGYTCGINGFTEGYGYHRLPFRTFPSSGGLQVPEVYLSVQAVMGAPTGLYHYHPLDSVLESIRPGSHGATLRSLALDQAFVENAAVVFLITGCFERMRWKYGDRAYRYMCMDIGFLGQNLYLAGEALGLGVCAVAGFTDEELELFLGVDGRDEIALLLAAVGVRAGQ